MPRTTDDAAQQAAAEAIEAINQRGLLRLVETADDYRRLRDEVAAIIRRRCPELEADAEIRSNADNYTIAYEPHEIEIIRDEIRRCGFRPDQLADEFEPRPIVGNRYRGSEQDLRAEVRYWVQSYTDTSGT